MAGRYPALWHGAPSGIGRKAQGRGQGRAGLEHGALPEPACRHPRRQQDHAASAGKERLYPLRCHPCGRRLAPLCLPSLPPPSRWEHKNSPVCDAKPLELLHGFYPCPSQQPCFAPEESKHCPCYKYRSAENPHGHRPECKFVNEKCLKTLSFLCRMCYNNTRPCVRDRKLCAIGVQ